MGSFKGEINKMTEQKENNKIINEYTDFYDAVKALRQKLYDGDYYTENNAKVYIVYNRNLKKFQVFDIWGSGIPMDEHPQSDKFSSIRVFEIDTDSQEFDDVIEDTIRENQVAETPEKEQREMVIDSFIDNAYEGQRSPWYIAASIEEDIQNEIKEMVEKKGKLDHVEAIDYIKSNYCLELDIASEIIEFMTDDYQIVMQEEMQENGIRKYLIPFRAYLEKIKEIK